MTDKASLWGKRIQSMFDKIAKRYDLMNCLMTFGRDRIWRQRVVKKAGLKNARRMLDIGTGTGGIALDAKATYPGLSVVAADFSSNMIGAGLKRPGAHAINWLCADALHLPFENSAFDAVTSGYLMRNVADVNQAITEQLRILKPGGRIICLDTTPPGRTILRPIITFTFKTLIPLVGQIVARDRSAYAYLSKSTQQFMTPEALAKKMAKIGFKRISWQIFMFGTMAIHSAAAPQKPGK